MKTARLLLAALSLAALAACGTEPITGSSPEKARRKIEIAPDAGGSTIQSAVNCTGSVVVTVDQHGNSIETCVVDARGPLTGSGG